MRLISQGRFCGRRVLHWYHGELFAGQGYALWKWVPHGPSYGWKRVASFLPGWGRHVSSATRLGHRLRRDGFHALQVLPDGTLVAALAKSIAILSPGETSFSETYRVLRGTRPLAIAATPRGGVYWGEYFDNPQREEVHVYGSQDIGRTWSVVYTFPSHTVRHIHGIVYDEFDDCLWMTTGDLGEECRLMRASTDWKIVETILSGSQQTRAMTVVPTKEAVYFATDTPLEQNHIYRLGRDGGLESVASIAGSGMQGCRAGHALFFSSAVEPSRVNHDKHSCIYGSIDGRSWRRLLRWRKDWWPGQLFQFGRILLPSGENSEPILTATGVAVRKEDGVMHAWRVT